VIEPADTPPVAAVEPLALVSAFPGLPDEVVLEEDELDELDDSATESSMMAGPARIESSEIVLLEAREKREGRRRGSA
jgi:hypothetical protein